MKRVLLYIFFLLGLIPSVLKGQVVLNEFTTYTNTDLFPYTIFDIIEDSDNLLWVATDNGLVKSDGHQFIRLATTSDGKQRISQVRSLHILQDGRSLLIGTTEGLFIYDALYENLKKSPILAHNNILDIEIIHDTVYLGTSKGLFKTSLQSIKESEKSKIEIVSEDSYIISMYTIDNSLIYGTDNHLFVLNPDGKISKILDNCGTIIDMCIDMRNTDILWIATTKGLLQYRFKSMENLRLFEDKTVRSLAFCRNNLWMGTNDGLYIINSKDPSTNLSEINSENSSLPSNKINKVLQNNLGDIFIGTDIGLSQLSSSDNWVKYDINTNKAPMTYSRDMVYDSQNMYIATQDGVLKILRRNSNIFEKIYLDNQPYNHNCRIKNLTMHGKELWITLDTSIKCMDLQTENILSLEFDKPNFISEAILLHTANVNDKGQIWICSSKGLYVLTEDPKAQDARLSGTQKTYRCKRLWKEQEFTSIKFYNNSAVAIGQGDIFVIDTETLYTEVRISGYQIQTLESYGGNIWFGGKNGLYNFKDYKKLEHIEGISNEINDICSNNGKIYCLSGQDILEYNPSERQYKEFSMSDIPLTKISPYGKEKLFLGSLNCFYILDLNSSFNLKNKYSNPIFTGLTIDNKKIIPGEKYTETIILPKALDYLEQLTLPNNINSFSLSFSVADFKQKNIRYYYRLKGYSDEWIQTRENQAMFSELKPGKYTFELSSSLDDKNKPLALDIHILPKWYQTNIAKFITIIMVILIFWGIVWYIHLNRQYDIAQKEKSDAMKTINEKKIFLDTLSHEISGPLTSIITQLGKISNQPFCDINAKQLKSLSDNSERIQTLVQKMTIMNESPDGEIFIQTPTNLNKFIREIWDEYVPRMFHKQIKTYFECDNTDTIFLIDKVKLHNAIGNILENSLKFTSIGGMVSCKVEISQINSNIQEASVIISDTGKGMSQETVSLACNKFYTGKATGPEIGAGLGLWLAQQAAYLHGGKLEIQSEECVGTTVTFTIREGEKNLKKNEEPDSGIWQRFNIAWNHNRKASVLLISQDVTLLNSTIERFSEHINIFTAQSAEDCLINSKANNIDLVIYDFTSMESHDNLWNNVRKWCNDPIIPMLGIVDQTTEIPGHQLSVHCDRILDRPINQKQLTEGIIWAILKHERNLDTIRREKLTSPQEEDTESPDEQFLKEMMEIIEKNIDNSDFNVEKLCQLSHYSSSQIYRNIKQLCDMTVVEFIRDVRLKKAASLLRNGKLTVNEIMYMSGFTSRTYFFRRFKDKFGIAPSEYREKFGHHNKE